MPTSSFFNPLEFAQGFARKVSEGYRTADKALGGWLPGGGTASPLTRQRQEGERAIAKRYQQSLDRQSAMGHGQANTPYVGKPGERSSKMGIPNALDVLNRAGANPFGFVMQNPNDLTLVKKYFTENPDVTNQYDLPTNMFLRYYTGVGAKGMQLSPEQGKQILSGISIAQQDLDTPEERQKYFEDTQNTFPAYAASYKKKVQSGMVPIATERSLPPDGELNYSLGRHWAKPLPGGGYEIDEQFDWGYAPKNKGGSSEAGQRAIQQSSEQTPSWYAALSGPAALAENLVTKGYGNPFSYRLRISPTGEVQTQPLPGNQ